MDSDRSMHTHTRTLCTNLSNKQKKMKLHRGRLTLVGQRVIYEIRERAKGREKEKRDSYCTIIGHYIILFKVIGNNYLHLHMLL